MNEQSTYISYFFSPWNSIFGPGRRSKYNTWTLTKRLEKKLDGNYTRMLRAILNRSWQQHPTRRQLYGHLPPITKTIQARRTRHVGHCWKSKDEIVSDVLLWTPASGQSKAGRPARTFIQQLCDDTGCNSEDLPEAMNDRETWRERGSGISVLVARHDDDDDEYHYCSSMRIALASNNLQRLIRH